MLGKLKKAFSGLLKKSEPAEKKKTKKPSTSPKAPKKELKKTSKKPAKKASEKKERSIPIPTAFKTETLSPQVDEEKLKQTIESIPNPEPEQEEQKGFFSKLKKSISSQTLSQEKFDELFFDLEITLLENNVALDTVDKIKESLAKDLVDKKIERSKIDSSILDSLRSSILSVLQEPASLLETIKEHSGVYTILFFGINGVGKTTVIAKIAHLLKENNISCVLASGDTFRAAAIEQLETHATNLDLPIIKSEYNADPASVAFDAKKHAEKNNIKVVLVDTAGRMYTKANLLKEMEKIVRVSKPDLKLFIGESITGNDAIEQAKTFNETIGIDGIILNKADIDEKAGTILSVSHVTNKPIYFLGTGQNYQDLQVFTKETVLKNLGLE